MRKKKVHMLHGAVGYYSDWTVIEKLIGNSSTDINAHDLYQYLGSDGYSDFVKKFEESIGSKDEQMSHSLIGYSMGGRLALHALMAMPSRWNKAMIVSAHTGFPDDAIELRALRLKGDEEWAHLAGDPELAWSDFLEQWNAQGVLQIESGELLGWADRLKLEDHRQEIADAFRQWSLGGQIDMLERLSEVNVPVTWVVGERDEKFKQIAEKAASVLPRCELHIVKDAGHRVPWEQPEAFHQIVRDWLS